MKRIQRHQLLSTDFHEAMPFHDCDRLLNRTVGLDPTPLFTTTENEQNRLPRLGRFMSSIPLRKTVVRTPVEYRSICGNPFFSGLVRRGVQVKGMENAWAEIHEGIHSWAIRDVPPGNSDDHPQNLDKWVASTCINHPQMVGLKKMGCTTVFFEYPLNPTSTIFHPID